MGSVQEADPTPAIDMLADLPLATWLNYHAFRLAYLGGYLRAFHRVLARGLGVEPRLLLDWSELNADDAGARLAEALIERAPTLDAWLAARTAAGIVHTVVLHEDPGTAFPVPPADLEVMAEAAAPLRDRVSLLAGIAPGRARETLLRAEALGLRGVAASPFMVRIPASDEAWEEVWRFCDERGWVAWVHTSSHFWSDSPAEIGHPRHLEAVARRHPNLTLIAGHAGFPWTEAMVEVARAHPRVFYDLSTLRPSRLPQGELRPLWDAATGQQSDRLLFAAGNLGSDPAKLLGELDGLSTSPEVRHAWRYGNAARLLGLK